MTAVFWQPADRPPPLGGGTLHIWRARAGVLGCAASPPGARNRELANLLLERLLPAYLGGMPELRRERRGRPFIPGRPLDFNLSHSGDRVVGAFARTGRVGVDIERMRPDRDIAGIARRFFTPEEARAVGAGDLEVFYRLWTAKEAALKMTGQGLAGGLASARPAPHDGEFGVVALDDGRSCPVRWFEAGGEFLGAVVHEAMDLAGCQFYELA